MVLWSNVYASQSYEALDVDEDLYSGFVPDSDRFTLDKLRQFNGDELSNATFVFNDPRLSELVFRYRARNFPATLNASEIERWQTTCFQKNTPKLEHYWNEYNELHSKADKYQIIILDELKKWLENQ